MAREEVNQARGPIGGEEWAQGRNGGDEDRREDEVYGSYFGDLERNDGRWWRLQGQELEYIQC